MNPNIKRQKRIRRHKRVRAKIFGTPTRPRLSVFKSHRHIHIQLVDDTSGKTLVAASTEKLKAEGGKKDRARAAAQTLVEKARQAGIRGVVFDRGGFAYHGRVQAVADVIREAGLLP